MAAAVDDDGSVAGGDQGGDLEAEIAAVADAAVEQDDRRALAIGGVPDAGVGVVDGAGNATSGEWRGAVGGEGEEFVVVGHRGPSD